jgi:hypothetical protein
MPLLKVLVLAAAIVFMPDASAQTASGKQWAKDRRMEVVQVRSLRNYEAMVVRTVKDEGAVVLIDGIASWESPKDPQAGGMKWTIHDIGRDLDLDGNPDLHLSSQSSKGTTHHVLRFSLQGRPQVTPVVQFSTGAASGGPFVDVPGRAPVMIAADYTTGKADVASPRSTLVLLEIGPGGRMRFARDLMRADQAQWAPPMCALAFATAHAPIRERCAEYDSSRRAVRDAELKAKLSALKSTRAGGNLTWQDYKDSGLLAAFAAEMNRYAYKGHGMEGQSWLSKMWTGPDPLREIFISGIRKNDSQTLFVDELRAISR